jgi:hypothetical protein
MTVPSTQEAEEGVGSATSFKPGYEPFCRRPFQGPAGRASKLQRQSSAR